MATWAFIGSVKGTPSLDSSVKEDSVRNACGGAACRCMLLGAHESVAMDGLGAPMVGNVGLICCLIKFHDKGLNPLAYISGGVLGYG